MYLGTIHRKKLISFQLCGRSKMFLLKLVNIVFVAFCTWAASLTNTWGHRAPPPQIDRLEWWNCRLPISWLLVFRGPHFGQTKEEKTKKASWHSLIQYYPLKFVTFVSLCFGWTKKTTKAAATGNPFNLIDRPHQRLDHPSIHLSKNKYR